MIGNYLASVTKDGLILSVVENERQSPQALIVTRREWGMIKRKIDNQFKKVNKT